MDNYLKSLKGIESLSNLSFLYLDGNPLTIEGLNPIEKLDLYELTIDRKVFDGIVFANYPEYLWNIENLEFVEEGKDDGKENYAIGYGLDLYVNSWDTVKGWIDKVNDVASNDFDYGNKRLCR